MDYHDESSVLKNAPHTELIGTTDKWPLNIVEKGVIS